MKNMNFKMSKEDLKLALVDTTSWIGTEAPGFYEKAFFESTAIVNFTKWLNIKSKTRIAKLDATSVMQDDDDDFGATDLNLSQKEINVAAKKINFEVAISTLEQNYLSKSLMPGSNKVVAPADFMNYVLEFSAKLAGQDIEKLTWSASDSEGLIYKALHDTSDGTTSGTTNLASKIANTTVTSSNVLAEIAKVYNAIPAAVLGKEDLVIFVSSNVMKAYKIAFGTSALSNGGFAALVTETNYLGIKLIEAKGMAVNTMFAAQLSNLGFGTDLEEDYKGIQIVDLWSSLGIPKIRFVARFKFSVDYVQPSEVVLYV